VCFQVAGSYGSASRFISLPPFGTVTNPKNEKLHDLTAREVLTFVPLVIMAFWIGLYPKPWGAVNASRQPAVVPSLDNGKALPVHAAQGGQ
jgi:NADH:ubiquinone oxidoreductase subunit 4 (subunit M)